MEPSSEPLELLREIRESQRELLDFTKKWKEEADRKNQEWQKDSDRRDQEWKDEVTKAAPGRARWEEANEFYIPIMKILLVVRLITIAMLGIIAATLWFK